MVKSATRRWQNGEHHGAGAMTQTLLYSPAAGEGIDGDWNPAQLPLAHEIFADESLEAAADHLAGPDLCFLANQYESVAGSHGAAKLHVVQSAKAEHFRAQQVVSLHMVAAELGCRLAH